MSLMAESWSQTEGIRNEMFKGRKELLKLSIMWILVNDHYLEKEDYDSRT